MYVGATGNITKLFSRSDTDDIYENKEYDYEDRNVVRYLDVDIDLTELFNQYALVTAATLSGHFNIVRIYTSTTPIVQFQLYTINGNSDISYFYDPSTNNIGELAGYGDHNVNFKCFYEPKSTNNTFGAIVRLNDETSTIYVQYTLTVTLDQYGIQF